MPKIKPPRRPESRKPLFAQLWHIVFTLLTKPSAKQKEAYARLWHNLSTLSLAASASAAFGEPSSSSALRAASLAAGSTVLFFVGGYLADGDFKW